MITIGADWLRSQWSQLVSRGDLMLPLSKWDDGDAFTLAELGPLPANVQTRGRVTLGICDRAGVPVSVQLSVAEAPVGSRGNDAFSAADGRTYRATGWVRDENGVERETPVQIVEVASALAERRRTLMETSLLSSVKVAVIGLGTGGISVALELAKAGVGHFFLLDADRLDIGNVARHHAGVSHAGRRKVYVARDLIHEKNPAVLVETHPIAANFETEALVKPIAQAADVIICATDDRPSKLFVNRIAITVGRTTIYGGAFRRAFGGQVLRVRPGRSPCYQCFVMAMSEVETDREVASAEDALEIAYSDSPVAVEPGLSLDVAPIALMVARLALHELVLARESTLAVLERDLAAPWYLWINRPEPGTQYAGLPPLSESSDEMTVLRWYGIHFEREHSCPACGDFASAARETYGIKGQIPADLPELPSGSVIPQED